MPPQERDPVEASRHDLYETEIPALPDKAILNLLKREEALIETKLQILQFDHALGGQTIKRLEQDLNQVCHSKSVV